MMETVAVKASTRETTKSKGARAIRREGLIPAVVYGGEDVQAVAVSEMELRHAVYTPDFKVVGLDIDGTVTNCVIRDIQFHPVTEEIVHVDFQRLVKGQKIRVNVPVRFSGTAPGLKAGGKLIQKLRRLTVMTTPEKLVSELTLDVSELELGQSVRVRDCPIDEGMEIMNEPMIPVASVEIPRALKSLEAEEAEAAEAAALAEGEEGAEGEGGEGDAGGEESGDK